MRHEQSTSNVPPHILKEVREQEARTVKTTLLGGLIRKDGQSAPVPERTRQVSDIRWR
jgi:hypothetical protein